MLSEEPIDEQVKQLHKRQVQLSRELNRLIEERDNIEQSFKVLKFSLIFVLITGPLLIIVMLLLLLLL